MRYFLVLLTMVVVTGCIPYSYNPITAPNVDEIDSSILGTWYWNEKSESGYIHIGLGKESKLLRLMMLDIDKDGELEATEFNRGWKPLPHPIVNSGSGILPRYFAGNRKRR